jgi:predicted dithiol-disulfide oxidoreductase (DUF899 family)
MSVTFEVDDFEGAVRHLREHDIAFFLGPAETKVCHWAAFRDPTEIGWSFTGESEPSSEVRRLRLCDCLVELTHSLLD